jgi:signal transduction histidine kinase/DNA-binding response OmpR family regulator
MATKKFWQHISATITSEELDDFRRGMVLSIAVAMGFAGWLMLWASLHYHQLGYLLASAILAVGALGSARLRAVHLRGALVCLILTLMGAIVCLKIFYPNSLAQYYFPLVVIVSGLLESNLSVFIAATLAAIMVVSIARLHGASWLDYSESITPNILIYLTAFTTWLSARQLLTALNWMRTAYKQAHHLLEQLRDERASLARTLKQLEEAYQRIEKMNVALIEARSAAEEARRLKAEFAANISHELRTPLNIIIGFSETMANAPEIYAGVSWSPILRGDVEQIYQSSRHLLSLIDDILDLTALDMHRLGVTIEETAIETVIEEAVAVAQDIFHAKRLYLRVQIMPGLPLLRIDATRIRQVLINLLTNASRFTTTGGVTITAQLTGHVVQVAVADTGIGIAPQDVTKVFEEFGQVDSSIRRKQGGSGLGVPLSKRLVELHHGRMWLESQPGRGSTFYFTLPTIGEVQPGSEQGQADRGLSVPSGRKTVLMVEPDPMLLNTVRRHLSQCEVVKVEHLADLPELIEKYRPTALIIDRQGADSVMPDLLSVSPDLPVMLVRLPGQLQNAQALGIRDFLIKPITRERLLEAIAELGQPVHSVLIVAEDPALVELVSRMLQAGGPYRILKAWGDTEALVLLQREPVDLVLLDWLMAEATGLMVLQEIQRRPGLADIPVIVLGNEYPDTQMSEEGLDLRLVRAEKASMAEMVTYLETLVAVLPLRGLPD